MPDASATVIRAASVPAPEVSVVIAAYNAGAFLRETLDSILAQTGLAFEVVVADDASTDRTAEVLAGFSDPRLTILRLSERLVVSAVRNRAFVHVRAPWLCVFDADDVMLPGKLAPHVRAVLGRPGAVWGYCGLRAVDVQLKPLGMEMRNRFDLLRLLRTNLIPHPMSLIRCDLLRQAGGYDETLRVNVDYDLWLRLLERAEPVFHDDIGLLYRRHDGALGHTNPGQAPVFERLRARLRETAPDPAMDQRRALLRDGLAFLDAGDAADWPTVLALGERLHAGGLRGFELDRRRLDAFRALNRLDQALGLALAWVQEGARGARQAPGEIRWALHASLALSLELGRTEVAAALVPLAEPMAAALNDPKLRTLVDQARRTLPV